MTTAVAEVMNGDTVEGKTVARYEDFPALRQMLNEQSLEASQHDNVADFVMDLMERILVAEDVQDIFAAQDSGMMAGKDFSGRPFYLKTEDISIRKSAIEGDGLPFYAMFKVTEIATGEEQVISCGGKTFMAVLHALRARDYFAVTDEQPYGAPVVIVATPSPAGAYLSLKPVKVATAKPPKNGKK